MFITLQKKKVFFCSYLTQNIFLVIARIKKYVDNPLLNLNQDYNSGQPEYCKLFIFALYILIVC